MSEEFSFVGRRVSVKKALEKATGEAKFGVDLKLDKMLYAKILRSPHAHARILRIDSSGAEKISAVKAVLTYKDVPQIPFGTYLGYTQDQYILSREVRYVGDPVAAVVAESLETAEEALERINVEYRALPAVFNPEEAMKTDAPQVHSELRGLKDNNAITPINVEIGDIEKGFNEADYIFEGTYKTSKQCHCAMEPHSSIVSWDRKGRLTVQAGTGGVFSTRAMLARALGISTSKVRVMLPPGGFGGGFGGKADPVSMGLGIAALLARKARRPVKMEFTREEVFACTETRHSTIIKLKSGVRKDGALTARYSKAIYDAGAYASHGTRIPTTAIRSLILYTCPNIKFEGYLVYTNKPVAGQIRGFGNPQHLHAVELQNDEIAEALGIDPMEWRLKNHIRVGDKYWMHAGEGPGSTLASCGLDECIRRGAERIEWIRKRKRPQNTRNVIRKGVGMACMMHNSGHWPSDCSSSAIVQMDEQGKFKLITGVTDHGGTGIHTVLAQICAEELCVNMNEITVTATDTETTLYDAGSFASGRTYIAGKAVMEAAADLKHQLLKRAAKILKTRVSDLDIKDHKVYVKEDPDRRISYASLVHRMRHSKSPRTIEGKSIHYMPPGNAPPFAAQFAEVEVDTETGQVKVLKIVAAHDCGRAINPLICEGQVEGGIQFGLGYALTEGLIVDDTTGKALNPTFLDYKIFSARDMPRIEVILVESIEPTGPYGAKGIGEPPLVPTAPAIANAIYNAVGVRINEIPMTPEKVLKALRERYNKADS
jgi:xanthine dehydrogenase molybdenum-binding subunit